MTNAAITSITAPAKGLLIYDSVLNQLMVNMGTASIPNWQTIAINSSWGLKGNSNINPVNNFIGTTNAAPLLFKVDNVLSGFIDSARKNTSYGFKTLPYFPYNTECCSLNSAFGYQALASNNGGGGPYLSGSGNTAVGGYALLSNTYGFYNTGIGGYALLSNTYGNDNTGIGIYALYNNLGGYRNTAVGNYSLNANTSGSYNTSVGASALSNNTTGRANTCIGADADIGTGSLMNATAIGANSYVTESNKIQLGDANVTKVNTFGNITVLNNKGLIRSSDATQQKKVTTTVVVNTTILPGAINEINFTFPETFSGIPDVYVGNITGGAGFADVIMTVTLVTTSGGRLFLNNWRGVNVTPNFNVKIIAIGPQ